MPYLIVSALYLLFVLIYVVISLFIIYHLSKYSTHPGLKTFSVLFFIIISLGLLSSNVMLFYSIDWNVLILSVFKQ